MNLQAERIDACCRQLKLDGLAERFEAIARHAAEQDWSFPEFLEQALAHERDARQVRSRQTLARMASFPVIKTLDGPRLLVIDEIGYLPFTGEQASHLFHIVSRRYERGGSMILTSKLPFAQWRDTFGDNPTLTAAMLDRISSGRSNG